MKLFTGSHTIMVAGAEGVPCLNADCIAGNWGLMMRKWTSILVLLRIRFRTEKHASCSRPNKHGACLDAELWYWTHAPFVELFFCAVCLSNSCYLLELIKCKGMLIRDLNHVEKKRKTACRMANMQSYASASGQSSIRVGYSLYVNQKELVAPLSR